MRPFPKDEASRRPGYRDTIAAAQAALDAGLAIAPRLTVAVDGSFGRGSRSGGWSFLAADGTFSTGSSERVNSIVEAELRAILLALSTLPAHRRLTVQSDSRIALAWLKEPTKAKVSLRHLAFGVQALAAERDVRFAWVKGHSGAGLHDGADRLAVAARRGREAGQHRGDWAPVASRIVDESLRAHLPGADRPGISLAA